MPSRKSRTDRDKHRVKLRNRMKKQKLMEDELIVARWPGSWTRKVGGFRSANGRF